MSRFLFFLLSSFSFLSLSAKPVLPRIFSNGMVLQQQSQCRLWGQATAGRSVTITTTWGAKAQTKADGQGRWHATVATPAATCDMQSFTVSDGERTTIDSLLIGELWLCSGQSNMEMPMKGFKNQPVAGSFADILHSTDPCLRLFTVKRHSSLAPADDVVGEWQQAQPASVKEFSATAYYFGRTLRQTLRVPVGLIVAAWGGSACEAWMAAEWLKAFTDATVPAKQEDVKSKNRTPTVLYNGMLRPLIGTTIAGVIWYQGEDNVPRYRTYADMFCRLVEGWRADWQAPAMPFYFCQIAPYNYDLLGRYVNSALLREQQSIAEARLQHSGMAVLLDAGLENGIHPRDKQTPGLRLAALALQDTYNTPGLDAHAPRYKSVEFTDSDAVVSFDRADMWLNFRNNRSSELFEIAGADSVFHPAQATIQRSKVRVAATAVPHPVAVRYGFRQYVDGDLYSGTQPVPSFRTDDWDK